VIGRKNLNPWADLRLVANRNLHDIDDDAVEIQEHARTETDIEAIIAVKRRRTRNQRLAVDSPLEESGFELTVPPTSYARARRRE
jgi:hypothetical protein